MTKIESIKNFYHEYKKLIEFENNEYMDKIDLLSELGELTLKHNMKKENIDYIFKNFDTSFDIDNLLKIIYDEWEEEENNNEEDLWLYVIGIINNSNLSFEEKLNILSSSYNISKK